MRPFLVVLRPFQELKRANNVVHLRHSLAYREG
jgi:hypothetical protein